MSLRYIRDFWQQHRVALYVRHLIRYLADELDLDRKRSKRFLFVLFACSYVKQACRIAGMKRPRVWSAG